MDTFEKKYNEALLRADEAVQKGCLDKDMFDIIFPPEESEDERIRKELVALFLEVRNREGDEGYWHDLKVADILAYLEKQKGKLGDISTVLLIKKEIDRRIETWQKSRKEAIAMECNTLADDAAVRIEELYGLISFLGTIRCSTNEKQKEQKPVEWSEEDELHRNSIISTIEMCMKDCERAETVLGFYESDITWLKSLRPNKQD